MALTTLTRVRASAGSVFVCLMVVGCVAIPGASAPVPSGSASVSDSPTSLPTTPGSPAASSQQSADPSQPPAPTDAYPPPTSSPRSTDGATSPPTSAPTAEGFDVTWQRHGQDPGLGNVEIFSSSAAGNGRFVAIGLDEDYEPAVWTSGNGTSWQRSSVPNDEPHDANLADVAAGGPGFVMVGYEFSEVGSQGAVFLSVDGREWERVFDEDLAGWQLHTIGRAGDKVVAFGTDDRDFNAAFVSHDGRGWEPLVADSASVVRSRVLAVELTGQSLVAMSTATEPEFACRRQLIVSRTSNGRDWTDLATLPDSGGADCAGSAQLAIGSRGWVAAAQLEPGDLSSRWQAWLSEDGSSWKVAENSPFDLTDVLADDAGFVAVGHYNVGGGCAADPADVRGLTWTSTDGRIWNLMPATGWRHREVDLLRRYDRTLIGIGIDWTVDPNGAIWTADLPTIVDGGHPSFEPPPPSEGCG